MIDKKISSHYEIGETKKQSSVFFTAEMFAR